MAILLSSEAEKLIQNIEMRQHGPDHRVTVVTGTIHDSVCLLQSIYATVERHQRAQFFLSLSRETVTLHITGGDMNSALALSLDIATYTQQFQRGSEQLQKWLNATQMVDVWRTHHTTTRNYTIQSRRHRIDFILISETWLQSARSNNKTTSGRRT